MDMGMFINITLPWRPNNLRGHESQFLTWEKCTQNAKGPNLACRWSLILLASGVKQG